MMRIEISDDSGQWGLPLKCSLCGGMIEDYDVHGQFTTGDLKKHDVCARCITSGDIPARLRKHAESIFAWAGQLSEAAEWEWETPSPDDWEAHVKAIAAENVAA